MSSLAAPTSPKVTRTGEVRASCTSRSTLLGIVAEKSSVCLSGRICPIIDLTCSAATACCPTLVEGGAKTEA